jgi:phospho-N-acetylmuramoyl-pentapeptide-transferase
MLSYLQFWEEWFGPFRLFQFISVRSVGAGVTALFIGFIAGPRIISALRLLGARQAFRKKEEVGELADLHEFKSKTPTMGGILIYLSVTISALLWAEPNVYVLASLLTYTILTVVGFADDYLKVTKSNSKGLPGRLKLLGQLLTTFCVIGLLLGSWSENLGGTANGPLESAIKMKEFWVPFLSYPQEGGPPILPLALLIPFFFITLCGSSNALNLTDGLDGLAIGCTVTVALTYGIMAYAAGNFIIADYLKVSFVPGTGELAIVCAALLGGSLAFLWYNAHPAEVFMGDTGSLAIGGLVGIIALMIHQPLTLIIVGGIFVMEAGSVILQVASFKTRGKRIFRMSPIHHHFELKGWKETKVVIRFWILSLLFALIGLATLKIR